MLHLEKQNQLREQYRALRPSWRPATEQYAQLVRDSLSPDSRLLDIGCGRGGLVEQLTHPVTQMFGVDPDFDSLVEHRIEIPRTQTMGQLPFASNQFDVVMASWVLEHWDNPLVDLQEISRVLRPSGRFIFITPNASHPLLKLNRLLARTDQIQKRLVSLLYGRDEDDTFPIRYRANTYEDIYRLASLAHLSVETMYGIEDPTYLAFHPTMLPILARWGNHRSDEEKLHLVGTLQKE